MGDEQKKHWSPGWRKPSEVMKLRKTKRQRKSTSDLSFRQRLESCDNKDEKVTQGGVKRRNPFGVSGSPARRRIKSDVETLKTNASEIGSSVAKLKCSSSEGLVYLGVQGSPTNLDNNEEIQTTDETKNDKPSQQHTCFPIDWSLKTRIRFTSPKPFTWSSPLRSAEVAEGTARFTRCCYNEDGDDPEKQESMWRQRLQQSLMFWSFPNLPWIKLFPRIVPEPKASKPSIISRDESIQTAVHSSWCESFQSAYYLLRNGHCPFFYLCTYQLTVLFRARYISGVDKVHVLIGPTTRGFREALKSEGIKYTMPLYKDDTSKLQDPHQVIESGDTQNTTSTATNEVDVNDAVEDNTAPDDEDEDLTETSVWLESMGFEKANFPHLNPEKIKIQRDTSLKWDNRPQSLVYVEGADIHALYNFLLNYRTMVAVVGVQAGIPPTILSPTCFEGASLKCSKLKTGSMRQLIGNRLQDINTLEINGPILPHNVFLLAELLQQTQDGTYNAAAMNHEPTSCFSSVVTTSDNKLEKDSLEFGTKAGIPETFAHELLNNRKVTSVVKDVKCKKNVYEWT